MEALLEQGTIVSINASNGTSIGEIVGVASDMGPAGIMYIVKLVNRGGQAWIDYPYSCVTVPRSMFTIA